MKETPILTVAALERIYLVPLEVLDATTTPIRDAETRILRDTDGLPICEA